MIVLSYLFSNIIMLFYLEYLFTFLLMLNLIVFHNFHFENINLSINLCSNFFHKIQQLLLYNLNDIFVMLVNLIVIVQWISSLNYQIKEVLHQYDYLLINVELNLLYFHLKASQQLHLFYLNIIIFLLFYINQTLVHA